MTAFLRKSIFFFIIIVFGKYLAFCQNTASFDASSLDTLISLGNHKLFLSARGNKDSKYTVIFESGAGGGAMDWVSVRSLIPSDIRTVVYDRSGVGKSEIGPLPQTMAQNVYELHMLLKRANIKGPFILVGQSIGGLIVRLYTQKYGKSVKGLVLVDPTHESSVLGSMKYGGWVRLREKAEGKAIPRPQIKDRTSAGYDSTVDYLAEEFQKMYLSSKKNPQELSDRPLIILGAGVRQQPPGTPDEKWKELRSERDRQIMELTALSNNSKFILASESGHMVHYDNPELVAKAILEVINSLTSNIRIK